MKKNIGCLLTILFVFFFLAMLGGKSPRAALILFVVYIIALLILKFYKTNTVTEDDIKIEVKAPQITPEVNNTDLKVKLLEMSRVKNSKDIAVIPMPQEFVQKEKWQVTLITSESKSVALPPFLEIIKQYPTYKEYIENDIQYYEVSFPYQYINEFKKVYEMVKSLRGTRVYICGDLMEKKELSKLLICAGDKNISPLKDFCYGVSLYTLNPFGCHRIQIHSTGAKAWYTFSYLKDGKVIIDKEKILQYMKANLKRFKYCPFMNLQEIWNNFLRLPNEISLYDENFAVIKSFNGEIEVQSRWQFYNYIGYDELRSMYGDRLLSKR